MSIGTTQASVISIAACSARVLHRIPTMKIPARTVNTAMTAAPVRVSAVARCCGSFSRVMTTPITTANTTIAPSAKIPGRSWDASC